ncbi:hypothetical protein EG835_14075 [bacterium]|nr:hypothetical protein [bacterium]
MALCLCCFGVTADAGEVETLEGMRLACGPYFRNLQAARERGQIHDTYGLPSTHAICNLPTIHAYLSGDDRQAVAAFDAEVAQLRMQMGSVETANIDRFAAELVQSLQINSCPQQEPATADNEIRRLWASMCSSLRSNDIEGALRCFSEDRRAAYRATFARLGQSELRRLGAAKDDLVRDNIAGTTATYDLMHHEGQQVIASPVQLQRDSNCRWRIESF